MQFHCKTPRRGTHRKAHHERADQHHSRPVRRGPGEHHSGRTGAVVTPDKPKPAKKARAKKSNIPTAVANQTPLRDLEAQMLANLVKVAAVRKDPTKITRPYLAKRFPAMVKLVDRGDLQYYTAARYGSAHDNAWISDALIARLRAGVKKA